MKITLYKNRSGGHYSFYELPNYDAITITLDALTWNNIVNSAWSTDDLSDRTMNIYLRYQKDEELAWAIHDIERRSAENER